MDIKLRARLSAYGRLSVESTSGGSDLPTPSINNVGNVVGVGSTGNYELFSRVTQSEIDSLFNTKPEQSNTVTKDDIDTLFDSVSETSYVRVSEKDIDSLFAKKWVCNNEYHLQFRKYCT